jgi:predicted  nucleic acid-binding Zn-ribbon protein
MAMNVEAEIRELQRRVGELEGSFGFLTNQVKNVHKDLLAFQEEMGDFKESMEQFKSDTGRRFERVEASINGLRKDLQASNNGLRKELTEIVASTMREVLREQKAQNNKS